MRAGRLRHLISIQSSLGTVGDAGDPQPGWDETTPFAQSYASIEPLRASEIASAGGVGYSSTHRVTMRYRAGVTSEMRVVFGVRLFNIDAIRNLEEYGEVLELIVTEGRTQGA